MKRNLTVYRFYIIAVVLLNVGCDQISKGVVRENVRSRDYIELVNDNLILTNVENTGAMLGFGANFPPIVKIILLQILPVMVFIVLLFRVLRKKNADTWLVIAFSFVIGGGMGNLIDRIAYGSVTDFFQIQLGVFKTGIFNMADVAVTCGVLLILLLSLFGKQLTV